MYKKILVAIDNSKASDKALKEAIQLAKIHSATLQIINIQNEYYDIQTGPFVLPEEYASALRKVGTKLLEKAEALAKKAGVKTKARLIEIRSSQQRIAEEIIEEAKQAKSNLIILGTHGRKGFHRIFLGSVAEGVARISPIPVLLVRAKE